MDCNLDKNKSAQVQMRGDHPICVSLSQGYLLACPYPGEARRSYLRRLFFFCPRLSLGARLGSYITPIGRPTQISKALSLTVLRNH